MWIVPVVPEASRVAQKMWCGSAAIFDIALMPGTSTVGMPLHPVAVHCEMRLTSWCVQHVVSRGVQQGFGRSLKYKVVPSVPSHDGLLNPGLIMLGLCVHSARSPLLREAARSESY